MFPTVRAALAAALLAGAAALSPQAQAATPRDALVMAWNLDALITFDPAQIAEVNGNDIIRNVCEPLVNYDLKKPEKVTQPDEKGNVLFRLKGYTNRKKVILSGTFNHWDEQVQAMEKKADGWELRLTLKPGVYEYKFIADGEWMHDPTNPHTKTNEHQTLNSVLYVTKPVRFTLPGYTDAKQVIISGSFNLWNTTALPMTRTATGWTLEVPLTGGKHLYKFIVDGNWLLDPANKHVETTWDGHENSVVMVR